MRKLFISLCLFLSLFFSVNADAVIGAKGASCLTGGTTGCLDSFDGSTLNDGDVAIVAVSDVFYFYILDSASGATESSPNIISPDSSAGNKRWILKGVFHDPTIATLANSATPSVAAGTVFLTGGVTTITDFTGGFTGKVFTIIAEHSLIITDGTNIFLNGSANYSMAATDTLTLIQKADGNFYEVSRSDN